MANRITNKTTKEINPVNINDLSLVVFNNGNEDAYKFPTQKLISIIEESQPDPPTPNLQEVTDEGATTSNNITLTDSTGTFLIGPGGAAGLTSLGVPSWNIDNTTGILGVNKVITPNGEIKPYKSLVILISQTGLNVPTAIILENNFGVGVSFTRASPGVYTLVLNGAFPDSDKVFHILENLTNTNYELDILNLNQLIIVTTDAVGNPTDGLLNKRCLEIRVYD